MQDFSVNFTVRTDLASEVREHWHQKNGSELPGTDFFTRYISGFKIETLNVVDKDGQEASGKPVGKYITVHTGNIQTLDGNSFENLMCVLSQQIRKILPYDDKNASCLLACLGNANITADAVGPLCSESFIVTNHIYQSDKKLFDSLNLRRTCCVCPGVLGKTGLESSAIIKGAIQQTRPSFVIAVDALACRHLSRLATTVQICSTGISPGSGIGNSRKELSEKTLGIPVIAIGLPTVVDARTLCYNLLEKTASQTNLSLPKNAQQLIFSSCDGFFVTPKETDRIIRSCSKLIGYSLNMALHPNITKSEIDELIS